MTFLRPGMKATYRLPDGSIYAVTIGTEGQPDMDDRLSGRELDGAIARHVFGLEVKPVVNSVTGKTDYVHRTPSGHGWVRVAFYSERMGASLEVEYELRKRGWTRVDTPLRVGSRWNEPSDPTVTLQHTDGRRVEATGPINTALCRAGLKAVEM